MFEDEVRCESLLWPVCDVLKCQNSNKVYVHVALDRANGRSSWATIVGTFIPIRL